jgi:hypothetical protein
MAALHPKLPHRPSKPLRRKNNTVILVMGNVAVLAVSNRKAVGGISMAFVFNLQVIDRPRVAYLLYPLDWDNCVAFGDFIALLKVLAATLA